MPRIRTIKPEFWSSPAIEGMSMEARLLFIAMWNWADDFGRGTANPKELAAFAFPHDDHIGSKELPTLCKEVADGFEVVFYKVDGRRYYEIPSWNKHQRTERKAQSRHPGPDEGIPDDPTPSDQPKPQALVEPVEPAKESVGISDASEGSAGPGTGEQGNSGTESAPRAPARTRSRSTNLAELNATAVKPTAWSLVSDWRKTQSYELPTTVVRQLQQRVDTILADRGDPEVVLAALDAWAARSDAGPALLPHLYTDALKAHHGATPGGRQTRADKVAGWAALAEDPTAAVGPSARGDKAAGWAALAAEESATPALAAITGGKTA